MLAFAFAATDRRGFECNFCIMLALVFVCPSSHIVKKKKNLSHTLKPKWMAGPLPLFLHLHTRRNNKTGDTSAAMVIIAQSLNNFFQDLHQKPQILKLTYETVRFMQFCKGNTGPAPSTFGWGIHPLQGEIYRLYRNRKLFTYKCMSLDCWRTSRMTVEQPVDHQMIMSEMSSPQQRCNYRYNCAEFWFPWHLVVSLRCTLTHQPWACCSWKIQSGTLLMGTRKPRLQRAMKTTSPVR